MISLLYADKALSLIPPDNSGAFYIKSPVQVQRNWRNCCLERPAFAMLQLMILEQMPLEEISFEREAFRISEILDSASIRNSLAQVGQLNPVILLDQESRKTIVCGFRRVFALKMLGKERVSARILSSADISVPQAFDLALWDNLSHRELNLLEKARVLAKLRIMCGIGEERLRDFYLPALGLSSSPAVLRNYLRVDGMHEGLRQCLLAGKLTHSSLELLAAKPESVQESVAELMDRIRLSASLQRKVLNLLEELASMRGASFDAPLKEPQMRTTLEDPALSPFQKGEKVHENLYQQMHPRLSRAVERFQNQKKLLGLPGSIQIQPHPFFEDPGVRVSFDAPDVHRLRQLTAALQKAAESPDMEELFKVE